MSRQIRRFGPYLLLLVALIGLSTLLVPTPRTATASSYTTPFWTPLASIYECPCSCSCNRPGVFSPEGVSYLTGELTYDGFVGSMPGVLGDFDISYRWRSMTSGVSQLGRGMVPSWEWTLQSVNSTTKVVRTSAGLTETWTLSSGVWSSSDCAVHATLTDLGSGIFERKDLQGNKRTFGSDGMQTAIEDRNGNQILFTHNGYQLTTIVDTRSKTWSVHHDGAGLIDYIDDPCGRRFTFAYDTNANLVEVGYPATTDQPLGTKVTLGYDGSDRLISVKDQRGNTTLQYAYVGSTGQIDYVTIDGTDVSYAYVSGRTDRTDRNGNVHRTHFSGKDITWTICGSRAPRSTSRPMPTAARRW